MAEDLPPIGDVKAPERWETARRPTGQEIFDSLSPEKQDEMLGPAAAEKIRQGEAILSDFVEHDGGFIRQKPVEDLPGGKAWREEDHPRGGDPENPGRFSRGGGKPKGRFRRGRKRGALATMPEDVEDVLWEAATNATLFWLGIPEISDSSGSWPREVKRTKKPGEWRCVYTFRFKLRVDVEGIGAAGSWHEFRAVMHFSKKGWQFRPEEWGGPPELRPGYVPPEEEPV